jgi:type II secretory pathway pseudopilin PulG
LIEVMVVVAILAILAAAAIPMMVGGSADARLKAAVRETSAAFSLARSEAIRTGQIHLVFVGTDASGTALTLSNGDPAVVVVVNDGVPGSANQNCQIDAGETVFSMAPRLSVAGGVLAGVVQMADDVGVGVLATGSTFTDGNGNPASWVLFMPDGTARAFDNGCAIGVLGSGAGGIYLNNGDKQFGFALRPLGNGRVRVWQEGAAQWVN